MSHHNKINWTKQVSEEYDKKLRLGKSKFEAKQNGTAFDGIYSTNTYLAYVKHFIAFCKYCEKYFGCKTIPECREHVDAYLQSRSVLSAYTVKLDAAAIGKMYGCSATEFVRTAPRLRENIKRSRGEAKRDRHFSEENYADLITFCRATGLRRRELEALRGDSFEERNGELYIHVRNGKGGKERDVRVIGSKETVEAVKKMMIAARGKKVFGKVSGAADIHGYRRDYTAAYYQSIARPTETLRPEEKYVCRKDKKGIVYDRQAMLTVSRNLGHNRIDVIAGHYLD